MEIFVAKMQDDYVFYFVCALGELKLNQLKMFYKKLSFSKEPLKKSVP